MADLDQLNSIRFMEKQIKLCGLPYRQTKKMDLSWLTKIQGDRAGHNVPCIQRSA